MSGRKLQVKMTGSKNRSGGKQSRGASFTRLIMMSLSQPRHRKTKRTGGRNSILKEKNIHRRERKETRVMELP